MAACAKVIYYMILLIGPLAGAIGSGSVRQVALRTCFQGRCTTPLDDFAYCRLHIITSHMTRDTIQIFYQ